MPSIRVPPRKDGTRNADPLPGKSAYLPDLLGDPPTVTICAVRYWDYRPVQCLLVLGQLRQEAGLDLLYLGLKVFLDLRVVVAELPSS